MFNLRRLKTLESALLLILFTLPFLVITLPKSNASGEVLLWLETQTPTVAIGESFDVTVMISIPSSHPVAGVQFQVQWNSTAINGTSISERLYHTVTPESEWDNIWALQLAMRNMGRYADYAYTFQDMDRATGGGYAPMTGTYVVAVITFKGAETGRCLISLPADPTLVVIGDLNGHLQPVAVAGLVVSVGNLPPVMEIVNPRDNSYSTIPVNLIFTANKQLSWTGYSLDDQPNVTLSQGSNGTVMSYLIQLSEGQHSLVVYANDSSGLMSSSNKVNFVADQTPPTISLDMSPSKAEDAAKLVLGTYRWIFTFNASESHGHLSNITYLWDFGDGTNSTQVVVTHEYRQPGTYNVTLSVTDLAGNTAAEIRAITISPISGSIGLSYELIAVIVIPAVWAPAIAFYWFRMRKKKKKA